MKTKNQIQREIIDKIVDSDFRGIVLSSVRSGKTRILLTAIKEHTKKERPKVLVMYPNIDIKKAWIEECELIGCPMDIHYCTFISIEKVLNEDWDYIVFDEAHLIPEEHKLPIAGQMAKKFKHVVFASGTYNASTLADIKIHTNLPLIVNYTTDNAIADGLISNFTVYIHKYSLNSIIKREHTSGKKKWYSTDTVELERLTKAIEKSYGDRKLYAAVARMRFINSNESLLNTVKLWIKNNPNKRFLLFVENEKFGKKFGLPIFSSKSKNDTFLQNFIKGIINQLCLIKKGSAGITYPNLDNIIITALNSNGESLEQMLGRALLTDTEHSDIHIFVSDNKFQLNWLNSALLSIDESKVVWIK